MSVRPDGVADHRGAAADQGNRTVAGHLQTFHQAQRHKVTNMQRVRRRVKSNIKGRLAAVNQFLNQFFRR